MKREEALSLLKELMVSCESLQYAPIVSLMLDKDGGGWSLNVKWRSEEEKACFDHLLKKRDLKVTNTADGFTIFHNP